MGSMTISVTTINQYFVENVSNSKVGIMLHVDAHKAKVDNVDEAELRKICI